jgi:hypothetical protein
MELREMRTLTMRKGAHQYVFRYLEGGECDVLEAVAELAADPANNFDWLDAASISFQITAEQAASCIKAITPARKLA